MTTSSASLTNIRRLPPFLDLYRLRNNLVLLAGIQEQRGRLEVRVGERWHAET